MGPSQVVRLVPRRRRRAASLSCAVALALGLSGCPASTEEPADPPAETALEIELVGGAAGLGAGARDEVQAQVGDALTSYVAGAFLGDYPRDDFVGALSVFTSGAAQQAARDLELLTASRYGDAEDVAAERLVARLSVFAADDEPAGASARVRFRFSVDEGEAAARTFSLTGRLSLVPQGGQWRIFAYDVERDDSSLQEAR